jgi:hypothetical protein
MEIHSLVVMKRSGVPIYHRNFSEAFVNKDFTMISSFLSAILDFSSQVVSQKLSVLEMGDLRFFIRNSQDSEIIFLLLTDSTVSVLLIHERIDRIKKAFFNRISVNECEDTDCYIENEEIDKKMDSIISIKDDYSDANIESIKKVFDHELSLGEFQAGAVLSLKGDIYYSSLPIDFLHTTLKEIEIRTKSSASLLTGKPKFIWAAGENMLFSQTVKLPIFQAPVFCVLLFDSNTSLGMADFALEDMINKLSKQ